MELIIFLARVFGLHLILIGIAVFTNRKHIMLGVFAIAKERFAQLMAGILSTLIGLFLINLQNDWSTLPTALLSGISWAILVKGMAYLFVPEKTLEKWVHKLSERSWYMADAALAVLVGLYLAGFGFGFF